jgi:hypothetical protein
MDATLWGSIVQLGELGEPFDVSGLFGLDLETALSLMKEDSKTEIAGAARKLNVGTSNAGTKNKENVTGNFTFSKAGEKGLHHTVPENRRYVTEMSNNLHHHTSKYLHIFDICDNNHSGSCSC